MPESPLTPVERAALLEALDDEYKARATYDQVIRDHGRIRPFTNIVASEGRHAAAIVALLRAAGAPVPEDPWPGRAPRFATPHAACEAGVAGEIENAAMYDRLLALPLRPAIRAVLRRLRRASQERHLPAFRRCAARPRRAARAVPPQVVPPQVEPAAAGRSCGCGRGRRRRHRGGRGA